MSQDYDDEYYVVAFTYRGSLFYTMSASNVDEDGEKRYEEIFYSMNCGKCASAAKPKTWPMLLN